MEQNKFFATAKPINLFFKVAIPGLISMLAMSLYQAFEGAFVGQWVGEAAFAAVTVGMPVVMINAALADLVGVGSSAPISVALGRKDNDKANNYFTCSVILIVLMAILTGIIILFAAPRFMDIMGAEGEFAELATRYVRVYAIMGPVATIVFAVDNYLRISGFIKGSMWLNAQRISRKAFYVRNGYKETGKFVSYRGVDYEILCKKDVFDLEMFKNLMKAFHLDGFTASYFEK